MLYLTALYEFKNPFYLNFAGPVAKRPNMGVIRQIGSSMRSQVVSGIL